MMIQMIKPDKNAIFSQILSHPFLLSWSSSTFNLCSVLSLFLLMSDDFLYILEVNILIIVIRTITVIESISHDMLWYIKTVVRSIHIESIS